VRRPGKVLLQARQQFQKIQHEKCGQGWFCCKHNSSSERYNMKTVARVDGFAASQAQQQFHKIQHKNCGQGRVCCKHNSRSKRYNMDNSTISTTAVQEDIIVKFECRVIDVK